MDATNDLTPDQLYEQAIAHYRAARWAEALTALGELLARGQSSPDIDMLVQDIKFKQRLDMAQSTMIDSKPPPRRPRRGLLVGVAGAVALVAVLGVGLMVALGREAPVAEVPRAAAQTALGALPTPAPAVTAPAPTPVPEGAGILAVSMAEGQKIAFGIENIYLILDASGSMLARVGDQRKIDLAQQAMVGLVEQLPADSNVALRTYGRQRPDDCSDVELLAPLAPLDRAGLIALIEQVEPVNLSRTPIGSSLAAVPADLGAVEGETLVVLVSDGEESCDADPSAIAAQIHAEYPSLHVSVVGFDIAPELRDKLARIAEAGGGAYFGADNVDQLAAALEDVVTPRFRVLDAAGAEIGTGQIGEHIDLPVGTYTVMIGADPVLLEQVVAVHKNQATVMTISATGEQLGVEVQRDWHP